jgi:hypothetical protein
MSFFSSPEGIKSGMYGLGLYVFGVSFVSSTLLALLFRSVLTSTAFLVRADVNRLIQVRMFKDTWFSAAGGGLGLSPAASQLALLAIGPPNAWITIKGLDVIG